MKCYACGRSLPESGQDHYLMAENKVSGVVASCVPCIKRLKMTITQLVKP